MKKIINISISILIYFFCFFSIGDYTIQFSSQSIILIVLFYNALKHRKKIVNYDNKLNWIFSLLFSISFLLGKEYYACNTFLENLNILNSIIVLAQISIISLLTYINVTLFFERNNREDMRENKILNSNSKLKIGAFIFSC